MNIAVLLHLGTAVRAITQARKRHRDTVLGGLAVAYRIIDFTHPVPQLLGDDRFMIILSDRPIIFVTADGLVILIAHGCGAELNQVSEIDRIAENTLDRRYAPQVRGAVRIRLSDSVIIVVGRYKDMLSVENIDYPFHIVACRPHFKDTADDLRGIRINDRRTVLVCAFHIAVRRIVGLILSRLCVRFKYSSQLL